MVDVVKTKPIMASTKVGGKRRQTSIAAQKRRVKDGQWYLIRRHGAYFRPGAHGYTVHLAAAGIFDAAKARSYLDVEGVSVVPLVSVRAKIEAEIFEYKTAVTGLQDLLTALVVRPPLDNIDQTEGVG